MGSGYIHFVYMSYSSNDTLCTSFFSSFFWTVGNFFLVAYVFSCHLLCYGFLSHNYTSSHSHQFNLAHQLSIQCFNPRSLADVVWHIRIPSARGLVVLLVSL